MTAYDKFSASLFGTSSRSKIDYLKNELTSFTTKFSDLASPAMEKLGGVYDWVKNKLESTHNELFNSKKLNDVRNYLVDTGEVLQDGFIHRLNLTDYRCNLDTKMFILSHPTVYRMNRLGILDNFENSINIDRTITPPEFRDEYIETYNNIVRSNGTGYYVTHYSSTSPLNDISIQEQNIRMEVWDVVSGMLEDGLDPTQERSKFK